MAELYIFNQSDKLLTIISEEDGLIEAPFRDELNTISDTPFKFVMDASEEKAKYIKAENRVVFKDREGDLREFVIKEIDDVDDIDGPELEATCIPAFADELANYIVDERRINDKQAKEALDASLEGTRYEGVVEGEFGLNSISFYYDTSLDALFNTRAKWGGDIKDVVELDDTGRISNRKILLKQRLGQDNGLRFEIDHNMDSIERTVISYPLTALYGRGASLETEGGGNTRYIDFADAEWRVSNGDPVDKPLGQKWVGDPDALNTYGYEKDGELIHRFGEFNNQDYDTPESLLQATWEALQNVKNPEVNYKLQGDALDKPANLGDSVIAVDTNFSNPIKIQSRIIAIEYDLLDIESTTEIEFGSFLNLEDNRIDEIEREIEDVRNRQTNPIVSDGSFPNIKPKTPINVEATGGFEVIQLNWEFDNSIYIKYYEVYGSQISDFVPSEEHLLWRGRVSSFAHKVETDQTWYYYVRASNYQDVKSDWSNKAEASTARINIGLIDNSITAEIEFAKEQAEQANINVGIVAQNAQEAYDNAQEALDAAQSAFDEATGAKTIAEQLDDMVEGLQGLVEGHTTKITNIENELSTKMSTIDADAKYATQSQLTQTSSSLSSQIESIQGYVDGMEIGGRNLLRNSDKIEFRNSDYRYNVEFEFENGVNTVYVVDNIGDRVNAYTWITDNIVDINNLVEDVGGEYVVSIDYDTNIETEGTFYFNMRPENDNSDRNESSRFTLNNTNGVWKRAYAKITVDSSLNKDRVLIVVRFDNATVLRPGVDYFRIKNIKLEKGNKATDWTPAPEDIQYQFSSITQTVDSINTKVGNNENQISTISQTVQGIQSTVEDKADKSTVTQLAGVIDTKITKEQADGWYATQSQLTQTASSLQSTITERIAGIEVGGRNIVTMSTIGRSGVQIDGFKFIFSSSQSSGSRYLRLHRDAFELNSHYVASFKVRKISGTVHTIAGHVLSFIGPWEMYRDGELINESSNHSWSNGDRNYPDDNEVHEYKVHFKTPEAWPESDSAPYFYIQPNRPTYGLAYELELWDYQIEKGTKATGWGPSPEDIEGEIASTRSQITQLADSIQSTVEEYVDGAGFTSENLLEGTSYLPATTGFSGWGEDLKYGTVDLESGQTYTFRVYLKPSPSATEAARAAVRLTSPSGGNTSMFRGNLIYPGNEGYSTVTFTVPSGRTIANPYVVSLFNYSDTTQVYTWKEAKLERGNAATPWSLNTREVASRSQITQLSDSINLRVEKNKIINEINISSEGILINGSKLRITAQTIIDNGVIRTAHIYNGTITNAKIANGAIDNAKIADATITSAKIASLNVDKLTGSIASFVSSGFNGVSSQVRITGNGLETLSSSTITSRLHGAGHDFYRNGARIGRIGTSYWVGDTSYRGLTFQMTNSASYMAWSHDDDNDGTYTTKLEWHKSGAKTNKGFTLSDNVYVHRDYTMYLRRLSTTSYASGNRGVELQNYSWNGQEGVAIARDNGATTYSKLFLGSTRAALIDNGNANIEVGNNSAGNYVKSIDIYNKTTSMAANVLIHTNGVLYRSTSASKYKLSIENEEEKGFNYKNILSLNVKSWYDKASVEMYSAYLDGKSKDLELEDIPKIRRHFGLIAEDVENAGLSPFVQYSENGEVEGIEYDRLWTLLIPIVRENYETLGTTSKAVNELILKVAKIEERLNKLEAS